MLPITSKINYSIIIISKMEENCCDCLNAVMNLLRSNNLAVDVQVIRGTNPSAQRNLGAREAVYDFLIFFDNDSVPSQDYFIHLQDTFKEFPNLVAVGGVSSLIYSNNLQKSIKLVFSSILGTGPIRFRYKSRGRLRRSTEKELILCNLILSKKIFLDLGGFHEGLYPNEENELLNRFSKRGDLLHNPFLEVKRRSRSTWLQYFKQLISYGRGRSRHFLLKSSLGDLVYFIPGSFALYVLLSPLHELYLPLYIYCALIFFATIIISIKSNDLIMLLYLPATFFSCHFFYGIGQLVEIFSFHSKKNQKGEIQRHAFRNLSDIKNYLENTVIN